MRTMHIAIMFTLCGLFIAACSDEGTTTEDSAVTQKDIGVDKSVKDDKGVTGDQVVPDAAPADTASTGDAMKCDFKSMSAETEAKGKKLYNGVKLKTSTPLPDLKASPSKYKDKVVRVEGVVVEICQSQGCYVNVKGPKNEIVAVKVNDGSMDFRTVLKVGQYVIGEGVFSPTGSHGAQVFIEKHGALIGPTICTGK